MTAGSDAHIAEMVGQAVTNVGTDERTVEAILDAIREGKTTVEGKRTPWRISFRQAAGGAKRRVKNGIAELLRDAGSRCGHRRRRPRKRRRAPGCWRLRGRT